MTDSFRIECEVRIANAVRAETAKKYEDMLRQLIKDMQEKAVTARECRNWTLWSVKKLNPDFKETLE